MRKTGGKKAQEVADKKVTRRRRVSDDSFTVGRTIAGASHRSHSMTMERQALHKKRKWRAIAFSFLILALMAAITLIVVSAVTEIERVRNEENAVRERQAITPTVPVIDENAGGELSSRTREFIVHLESDAKDYGFEIDHIVVPFQKARQLFVFVKEREEYYKVSLDRSSAMQAEDMGRMMSFLDENGVKCSYVDLRVEGRAYYK